MIASLNKKAGFTIVELLIVIVIIGILAAIVIVAYRGIQERANNTQTISVAAHYVKALRVYATDNNKYPEATPGAFAISCLGEGYPNTLCANYTYMTPANCASYGAVAEGSWFHDAIKPYTANKTPTTSLQEVNCGGTPMRGGVYGINWYGPGIATVAYILSGNTSCGSPGGMSVTRLHNDSASTLCKLDLPAL